MRIEGSQPSAPPVNKKSLPEIDICDKFITPAVQRAGWDLHEQIYREYTLRLGRIVVQGRTAGRDPRSVLRADYVLFHKTNIPLPPLPEQHRIVARVQQLRALCAQLRERLQQARRTQGLWADALVEQAA